MKTVISRDGTRIAYVRRGSGPALVMVHGTTADHTRWDGVTPWLEADAEQLSDPHTGSIPPV
jgi:pimeloyl-ACP methyl ester carboxylesterase